jgi:hypothetical protein
VRFFFLVNGPNQVRVLASAASALAKRGVAEDHIEFVQVDQDGLTVRALTDAGLAARPLEGLTPRVAPRDVVVLANDWVPAPLLEAIAHMRQAGAHLIGVVEGCRYALPGQYDRVDQILAWGPSAVRSFKKRVHVVGSPMIERTYRRRPSFDAPAFALINYKFTHHRQAGREGWIRSVIAACDAVGVPYRISRHPADRLGGQDLPIEPGDIENVIMRASVLISRPSTAIYQAIAAGVPVVHFPTDYEELEEFAEPLGAYETAHSADELPQLIAQSLAARDRYHVQRGRFLERHVSMIPGRPAGDRMARVLLRLSRTAPRRCM